MGGAGVAGFSHSGYGGRWEHSLRNLQGVHWFAQKSTNFLEGGSNSYGKMPYMPALGSLLGSVFSDLS